jgi:hypothetical protein
MWRQDMNQWTHFAAQPALILTVNHVMRFLDFGFMLLIAGFFQVQLSILFLLVLFYFFIEFNLL